MTGAAKRRPPPSIRRLAKADIPAVVDLIEAGSHEPWSPALITQVLAEPTSWGSVALIDGGQPAGAVLARAVSGEAEILNLVVEPGQRRKGIGSALLARTVREAAGREAASLYLEVAVDNEPALALYASAGFRTVGSRPQYYTHAADIRVDALIMCLDLVTSTPR